MKKIFIFPFLALILFLPHLIEAAGTGGKCICETKYRTETERRGDSRCKDTYARVCETGCSKGENCTGWARITRSWEVCDVVEDIEWCWCENQTICSISSSKEYNCVEKCDGRLQERIRETGCGAGTTSWVDIREGFEWQKCDAGLPGFYCDGECVEAPANLRHYKSPVSPMVAEDPAKLPVRLAWDDVPGWRGGWTKGANNNMREYWSCRDSYTSICRKEAWQENPDASCWGNPNVKSSYAKCLDNKTKENCQHFLEEEECEKKCPPEEECYKPNEFVQSYKITITGELRSCDDGSDINIHTEVLHDSEFIPPCSCFFKSNRTYNWTVVACCNEDGTNCGPPSTKQLKTSLAPEPVLPYDPDWADKEGGKNLDFEQSRDLEWCEIEDSAYYHSTSNLFLPLSYRILIYYFNEDEGKYLCHPLLLKEGNKCLPEYLGPEDVFPPNKFFARNFITRDSAYAWQVAACRDYIADDCGPYSQEWRFSTTTWDLGLSRSDPPDNKEISVGLPLRLAWVSSFSNSFNYRIYKGEVASCGAGGTIAADRILDDEMILNHKEVEGPLKILELDTVYTWCIQPCRDFEAKDCDPWGGPWYFKTTGRPPKLDTMKPDEDNVFIPTEFSWEKIPGAESYWFQLNGKDPILIPGKEAKIELDYPDLRPESSYSWKVQTCAQIDGQICGDYSLNQTFKTFKWQKPSDPKPGNGEKLSGNTISWEKSPGADFSEYTLTFVELDKDEQRQEECQKEIDKTIDSGITSRSSVNLSMGLGCWGKYRWKIVPCLDENCDEKGPESVWFFTFKATFLPPDTKPGLIPCNQPFYDPERPWVDETEPCGIKHLFIVLFIIIDFLFINVLPMILVLLVLASGVIFYFSIRMEAPDPAAKVKSLWKAAGIGIGLMLFAWIITASLLTLFGYHLGPWHIFG